MNLLKPFAENPLTRSISIETTSQKTTPTELILEFTIRGDIGQVCFAESSLVAARRDELWKHTCLECFFSTGLEESAPYFEVNCAPSGDWNAYAFSSYRQGMTPSQNLGVKLTHRESSENEAFFRISVSGDDLLHARHLGMTAVIEFTDGTRSFFALAHPGPQADFHLKKSFSISL
ncbi:DOMON-like domain-containing protein [Bdellovibrio svalbardensis]|uniref:DOMON-like domain-containing protein n=1 Tax=Bdellovibrio svalbardensis TaxID=2972972 RepID=A0ABT6DHU3_9BACT|nr:DOMON-like domain-containing protein [Bdellovibrio svalbardensis]MDG0816084.1 DOMON-like domain-containing protein [Bdellovibrio svalbardensis]